MSDGGDEQEAGLVASYPTGKVAQLSARDPPRLALAIAILPAVGEWWLGLLRLYPSQIHPTTMKIFCFLTFREPRQKTASNYSEQL